MIDLIRQSALPSNLMQAAAKGALNVPAREMIEILVYLTQNPVFAEQARMTLAGWDEASSRAAASDPRTAPEVLEYFLAPENRRPSLLPALVENISVPESGLLAMAENAPAEVVQVLLASARARQSGNVLHALESGPQLSETAAREVKAALAALDQAAAAPETDDVLDDDIARYLSDHAAEIAEEESKPFRLIGGAEGLDLDELEPSSPGAEEEAQDPLSLGSPPAPAAAAAAAPTPAPAAAASREQPAEKIRGGVLQKIQKLPVGERVQLAMKGNKEERFILIRDGAKVVAVAVLESPKLTDSEAESFAAMKNVQEAVLRGLAGKRRFAKHYGVIRNLVCNPRCPLDVALTLMKNLLVHDLKNLSINKEVSDTVRKLGFKLFKQKSDTKKPHG